MIFAIHWYESWSWFLTLDRQYCRIHSYNTSCPAKVTGLWPKLFLITGEPALSGLAHLGKLKQLNIITQQATWLEKETPSKWSFFDWFGLGGLWFWSYSVWEQNFHIKMSLWCMDYFKLKTRPKRLKKNLSPQMPKRMQMEDLFPEGNYFCRYLQYRLGV